MSVPSEVERRAESLRQEPYHLFRNDCVTKSHRLKCACRDLAIPARQVLCLGYARAHIRNCSPWVPAIHSWVVVNGVRIETSRPLGHAGLLGIVPVTIKPVIAIQV
jgi:hypothetical protein